ncbi:hypothetical protein HPB51_005942 [Rhipicephalus microplus]|nr:hypothetical protein HPB51_005942 [Rhipicephalus microplus]
MRHINTLKINGCPHSVNAFVAPSEGITKGVNHGLDPHTTPEALKANLRIRTPGVEILQARMFKNAKTAAIAFSEGLHIGASITMAENLLATPTKLPPRCEKCAIRLVTVWTSAFSQTLKCVMFVDNGTLQPDTSALRSVQLVARDI